MFKIITNRKLSWFTDTISKLHGIIEQCNRTIKRQHETINHLTASIESQELIIRYLTNENNLRKRYPFALTIEADTEQVIEDIQSLIKDIQGLITATEPEASKEQDITSLRDEKGRFKKKE